MLAVHNDLWLVVACHKSWLSQPALFVPLELILRESIILSKEATGHRLLVPSLLSADEGLITALGRERLWDEPALL